MSIKKCITCKKIFAPIIDERVCPRCLEEEEEQYKIVKDYLWDNPGSTIIQINQVTGVSENLIQKFVREGRFLQIEGIKITIDCEKCGKSILEGRFCSACSERMQGEIMKLRKVEGNRVENVKKEERKFHNDRIKRK